jgi:hypothetical protein
MASLPPKKGPRMTRVCSQPNMSQDELARLEFDADMDAFARKVGRAIDDARSKMSDEERERADRNATAILKSATDAEGLQRKGA